MFKRKKVGYVVNYTKQVSTSGEQVTITTNLPENATKDDFYREIEKMAYAPTHRMQMINDELLRIEKKEKERLEKEKKVKESLKKQIEKKYN